MEANSKPVIVIVGQTASGKSALALKLAKKLNGEIISADSRAIYRGMDIGTAKPEMSERELVEHHGLDLIDPDQNFSAAEFKSFCRQTVSDIHKRGKLPIIAGGTGLYIDSYLYDYTFTDAPDPHLRNQLENMPLAQLQERARSLEIKCSHETFMNPRHLSRAIERGGFKGSKKDLPKNILVLGIKIEPDLLQQRIEHRVEDMFARGLVDEVKSLINKYGDSAVGLQAPGYGEVILYITGNIDLAETKKRIISSHKYLAKRQLTWFKRNKDIKWCESEHQVHKSISNFLSNFDTIAS